MQFETLRTANAARVGQFKTNLGTPAHSKPDGSDWQPSQWLEALLGELGEWAEQRLMFEHGQITAAEFEASSGKELADVQIYLDLLSQRSLDVTSTEGRTSPSYGLMIALAQLGRYANARKKLNRGDFTQEDPAVHLTAAIGDLLLLQDTQGAEEKLGVVTLAHPTGVDLGKATRDKFNEVSARVGVDIVIGNDDIVHTNVPF